jgi:hypothetical protein
LRDGAESVGLRTGTVGLWVYEPKQVLRIGAVAAVPMVAGRWSLQRSATMLLG